jgi:hypothetical protein
VAVAVQWQRLWQVGGESLAIIQSFPLLNGLLRSFAVFNGPCGPLRSFAVLSGLFRSFSVLQLEEPKNRSHETALALTLLLLCLAIEAPCRRREAKAKAARERHRL